MDYSGLMDFYDYDKHLLQRPMSTFESASSVRGYKWLILRIKYTLWLFNVANWKIHEINWGL